MQPIAFLVLLNLPGENKLRNLKYFLGRGDNVLGSDRRCQIILPQRYELPHHIANIRVGYNFLTLEAFHPHLLYVESNLTKGQSRQQIDNYFPLSANTQYLPRIGEFFFIGRIKAVIGMAGRYELLQMKNIQNAVAFAVNQQKQQEKIGELKNYLVEINENIQEEFPSTIEEKQFIPYNNDTEQKNKPLFMQFQKKIELGSRSQKNAEVIPIIPQQEKSHTQVLDEQNYQMQPTLLLEDGIYAYQPTLNLDQAPIDRPDAHNSHENNPQIYSQQLLMNEIRRRQQNSRSNNNQQQQQLDFSMPDTIVDKQVLQQNKPMFELVESKEEKAEGDDDQDMPPTIREQEDAPSNRIKPTKTMVNPPRTQEIDRRLYHSGPLPKESTEKQEDGSKIQDFMDLFGMSGHQTTSTALTNLRHKISDPLSDKKSLMQLSSLQFNSLQEKLPDESPQPSPVPKLSKIQEQQQSNKLKQRVHFVGFKPTSSHRDFLKKQNCEIVNSPDADYDILLVKEPLRISNRLLLALIDGKRIETQQWIFNKQAQIQSKLSGLNWKQIYEKKGTHKSMLKGKGRFYISKRLDDLFQGIVQKLGGEVTKQLTDKKRVINIILRAEDSQDTEIYLQNHENKKWRFLKSEILVDAILHGKYTLEDKYIINLFDEL